MRTCLCVFVLASQCQCVTACLCVCVPVSVSLCIYRKQSYSLSLSPPLCISVCVCVCVCVCMSVYSCLSEKLHMFVYMSWFVYESVRNAVGVWVYQYVCDCVRFRTCMHTNTYLTPDTVTANIATWLHITLPVERKNKFQNQLTSLIKIPSLLVIMWLSTERCWLGYKR